MTCNLEEHDVATKCTRLISFNDDDVSEELALWIARHWANLGVRCKGKTGNGGHSELPKLRSDQLPDPEEIEAQEVLVLNVPQDILDAASGAEAEGVAPHADEPDEPPAGGDEKGSDPSSSGSSISSSSS